ncbi:dinucleotide-utilizing enzyme [Microbacterium lacticum]|uniref:dinucleotide-utilizing enzyme n=1 Tax=Microbacterium lacticum TaxID=33885 RepID=UPI0018B05702|nr:dinucleotide-utilizing enzyme [Microbacterium lacticum]MBF9334709.1 dinucleotide-utilizing enzyme [Microbacterium lacticum]
MSTTRLSRSIPFWVLVGGSVVAIAGGAYLLISKLTTMASTLTDGTATGVEVYAGQIWAVLGAILIGAGLVGLALALVLGALNSAVAPAADAVVVEPWEEDVVEVAAPVTASEPVVETDATPNTDAPRA